MSRPRNFGPFRRWRVMRDDGLRVEVLFHLPVIRSRVAELYPGCQLEALPEEQVSPPHPDEVRDLRDLIARALSGDSIADRSEALQVALRDPREARRCLEALSHAQ